MKRRLILKNEGFISRSFLEGQSESGWVAPAQLPRSANVGNVTSGHQIALFFPHFRSRSHLFSRLLPAMNETDIRFSLATVLLLSDRFLTRSVYFNIKRGASPKSVCQRHLQNSDTVPADALRLISGPRSTEQSSAPVEYEAWHRKNM